MEKCIKQITRDSGLYKSLLSFLPEEISEIILRSVNSTEFSERFGKFIETKHGEPTITSILNISKVARDEADITKLLPLLNEEWGLSDKSKVVNFPESDKLNTIKNLIASAPLGGLVSLDIVKSNSEDTGLEFNQATFKSGGSRTEVPTLLDSIKNLLTAGSISKRAISSLIRQFLQNDNNSSADLARSLKTLLRGNAQIPDTLSDFVVLALEGTPGVTRLIEFITSKSLSQVILGENYTTFSQLYKGDESKLARRATSYIMQTLLSGQDYTNTSINNYELASLQRLAVLTKTNWEALKTRIPIERLDEALHTAGYTTEENLSEQISEESLKPKQTRIQIVAQRELTSLRRALKAEVIRLNKFQHNKEFSESQKKIIRNLELKIKKGNYKIGLYEIIKNADKSANTIATRIATLEERPLNERISQLRHLESYISSYLPVINDIIGSTDANMDEFNEVYSPDMIRLLKDTRERLERVTRQYNALSSTTFLEFLKAEFGADFIEIKTGSRKGKYYFSDLIDNMGHDIGFADLWLTSMASSPDLIAKVLDQAYQKREYVVYDEIINILRSELQDKAEKLFESQGNRDTSWMFEKSLLGIPTGFYIRPIDFVQYTQASSDIIANIKTKTDNPIEIKQQWNAWKRENTEIINGVEVPKESLYSNITYKNLTTAQKEFYNAYIAVKTQMDEKIGVSDHYKVIQIRKDFVERLTTGDPTNIFKEMGSSIQDSLYRRVDDVGYAYKDIPTDFENNPIYSLPIHYVRTLENATDLSTDAHTAMFAYASMAVRYEKMSKFVDTIELSRSVLSRRGAYNTAGDKILRSRLQHVKDESFYDPIIKTKEGQNAYKRLNHYFADQFYQGGAVDSGTVGKVDVQKGTNMLIKLTTIKNLGLSLTVGLASFQSGLAFTRTESIAGEFFTMGDMVKADGAYFGNLLSHVAEIANPFKTNKLSLFLEKFDVSQEGLRGLRGKEIERSTLARLVGMKTLMFFLGAGDHYLRARVAIAMAHNTKLKDGSGKEITLWDALETVPIDPNKPTSGSKLVIKENVTKSDGSEFSIEDSFKLSRRYGRIIQRVVGNTNEADRSAAKRTVIGKLGLVFRNFMPINFEVRFRKSDYDIGLEAEVEGYYRTAARIILNGLKELRQGRLLSMTDLTDLERVNLRRAAADFGQFALVSLAFTLVFNLWDEDKNPWYKKMILYQLRRSKTELGAMLTPKEALNILRSPTAATSIIESTYQLASSIFYPPDWFDTIEGGRFKGDTKLWKNFALGPFSPYQTFYNQMNPDQLMKSLEN